jgi:hypothetical protein
MANTILLGWPRKKGFIDKLMGEVLEQVLENTDKMVIITNTDGIAMTYSGVRLICPPLAEMEKNFALWLKKVDKLAAELSVPIDVCANENTADAIRKMQDKKAYSANYSFKLMSTFEKMEEIAAQCSPEEIIILISARPGAVSDTNELDSLPKRMENIFEKNHRLIIIP